MVDLDGTPGEVKCLGQAIILRALTSGLGERVTDGLQRELPEGQQVWRLQSLFGAGSTLAHAALECVIHSGLDVYVMSTGNILEDARRCGIVHSSIQLVSQSLEKPHCVSSIGCPRDPEFDLHNMQHAYASSGTTYLISVPVIAPSGCGDHHQPWTTPHQAMGFLCLGWTQPPAISTPMVVAIMQELAKAMEDTFAQLRAELAFAFHAFLPPTPTPPEPALHSPEGCTSHDLGPSDGTDSPPAALLSANDTATGSIPEPIAPSDRRGFFPQSVQDSSGSTGFEQGSGGKTKTLSTEANHLGLPELDGGVPSTSSIAPGEKTLNTQGCSGGTGCGLTPNSEARINGRGNASMEIIEDSECVWRYRIPCDHSAGAREEARSGNEGSVENVTKDAKVQDGTGNVLSRKTSTRQSRLWLTFDDSELERRYLMHLNTQGALVDTGIVTLTTLLTWWKHMWGGSFFPFATTMWGAPLSAGVSWVSLRYPGCLGILWVSFMLFFPQLFLRFREIVLLAVHLSLGSLFGRIRWAAFIAGGNVSVWHLLLPPVLESLLAFLSRVRFRSTVLYLMLPYLALAATNNFYLIKHGMPTANLPYYLAASLIPRMCVDCIFAGVRRHREAQDRQAFLRRVLPRT